MNRFKNNFQFWPQMARLALVAIAYWVAVRLGLLLVAQPEGVASIWPASGLALAILLLSPKSQWAKLLAVIFVTNVAGNLSGGNTLPVSFGFALANTLEAFLGAWALIYFCKSKITFERTLEIFILFGVAIISNGLTALLGAAMSTLAFGAPFFNTWLVWWTSDGLGMILVAPFIVTLVTGQPILQSASPRRLVEAVALVFVLTAFAWLLFGPFTFAEEPVLRNYMLFPLLIWLAFRYSPRGMASALLLLTVIAIWNTLQGYGIFAFADQNITQHLVSLQMLLTVITFSGLFLSAILTELKQAGQSLRESEALLFNAFNNSPLLMTISDLSTGKYLEVNDSFCMVSGFNREEAIGRTSIELGWISAKERTRMVNQLQQHGKISGLELALRSKSGKTVICKYLGTIIQTVQGNKLFSTAEDITEHKQAEEKIRQLNAELEKRVEERTQELRETQEKLVRNEKLAVLGQMASSVGHELRNPLSVMTSAIYYLKLIQPNADAKVKEYLGIIDQEVHTSEKIITDLLDFARVKSVEREAVSVSDLIRQALERFPAPPTVQVTIEISDDLPPAFVDPRQMIQVLGNLTLNACQAMKDGGRLTVDGRQLTVNGQPSIVIAVKDTGVGITPENMKKLFEPLFTTKTKGIGLGLAVSKKLVEANGGKIEVESEPGKGSVFTVYLPVSKELG